jgi:hypothetical protein
MKRLLVISGESGFRWEMRQMVRISEAEAPWSCKPYLSELSYRAGQLRGSMDGSTSVWIFAADRDTALRGRCFGGQLRPVQGCSRAAYHGGREIASRSAAPGNSAAGELYSCSASRSAGSEVHTVIPIERVIAQRV